MTTKHTPGPWHESVGEIRSANRFCIATMEPPHPATKGKDRAEHRAYQQANARLIAAAPELLSALQGLLNALPSATTHPAIKAAHAAIKKAIGE